MFSEQPSAKVAIAVNCWVAPTAKLAGATGSTSIEAIFSTVKRTLALVMPSSAAVILAVPATIPVAKPVEEIVAVAVVSLAQVTSELIFAVEPSEYVAVAIKFWVAPTARIAGAADVTAMEDNFTAATTGKLTAELVNPSRFAVMLVVPAATPVAVPSESMVAIAVLSLAQVA